MKRRLDLALALVHRPRILFLDEPTTGLDPQSRTALWEEVARLAREDGVTVFLTTQYLEEADVLADRVGIIDRGTIVAEGTPDALKAEIGRPTLEVVPADPDDSTARDPCSRASARDGAAGPTACGSTPTATSSRTWCARSTPTARGRRPAAARADAGRRLPGEDRPQARGQDEGADAEAEAGARVRLLARSPSSRGARSFAALRQPARVFFAALLPARPAGRERERPPRGDQLPGFPDDDYLDFALAMPFVQGAPLRAIHARRGPRARHRDRLPQPARADADAERRAAGRAARRRVVLGVVRRCLYLVVGLAVGVDFARGPGGVAVLIVLALLDRLAFGALGRARGAPHRLGRGRAGPLPALLRRSCSCRR